MFIRKKNNVSLNETTSTAIAAVSQTIDATAWRGQQVIFSLWMRSMGDHAKTESWMRASRSSAAFWTSSSSHDTIMGWKEIKVPLSIPEQAETIDFGFLLTGDGQVWVRDIKLELASAASIPRRSETLTGKIPISTPTAAPANLDLLE